MTKKHNGKRMKDWILEWLAETGHYGSIVKKNTLMDEISLYAGCDTFNDNNLTYALKTLMKDDYVLCVGHGLYYFQTPWHMKSLHDVEVPAEAEEVDTTPLPDMENQTWPHELSWFEDDDGSLTIKVQKTGLVKSPDTNEQFDFLRRVVGAYLNGTITMGELRSAYEDTQQ
jgi:hypothetical protein